MLTGYNTKANALKGVSALHLVLGDAYNTWLGKYEHTDHTKPAKKK